MESPRSFTMLASRLGFAVVGYRAEGTFAGTTVTLLDIDRSRAIAISCSLVRPLDLELTIALGSSAPRAITESTKTTGDAGLDGWVAIHGRGEVDRAAQLLTPALRDALRALSAAQGVRIRDTLLEVVVAASAPIDLQESLLGELIALRQLIEQAAHAVPVSRELRPAWPNLERSAAELGVEARGCAFGLQGHVDGCRVSVFRFLPAREMLLVHVDFPTPLAGDVLLNSHLGSGLRPRLRSLASTLLAVGLEPGWFAFGSRFKVTRGSPRDALHAFGGLAAIAAVARSERTFLNVTAERLITGVRLRDNSLPADLPRRVRMLSAAARQLHDASPGPREQRGPYR